MKEIYHVTFNEDDEVFTQIIIEGDEINFNENISLPDDFFLVPRRNGSQSSYSDDYLPYVPAFDPLSINNIIIPDTIISLNPNINSSDKSLELSLDDDHPVQNEPAENHNDAGVTTRRRVRDSEAASAHECIYVNFLSEIEPKKVKCKYATRNTGKGPKMKKTWILTRLYGVTPTIVLRHHGFVGHPFDYRVTLGFGSIAGGLDHVNHVIRLPPEHVISRVLGLGDHPNPSLSTLEPPMKPCCNIAQENVVVTVVMKWLGTMAGVELDTLTMEQYLALSRENQAPGMVKPEIRGSSCKKMGGQTRFNTPKMGRSGIWVREALLHNTTSQDTRERSLNVSFEK
ncbi:hypothetical protein Tco_0093487 [Tanacetum coccineum]